MHKPQKSASITTLPTCSIVIWRTNHKNRIPLTLPQRSPMRKFSSSSVQSTPSDCIESFSLLVPLRWKVLVAHHISPLTGHLACELLLSGVALRCRLKNTIAFPLVGFRMSILFVQLDHIFFCSKFSQLVKTNRKIKHELMLIEGFLSHL